MKQLFSRGVLIEITFQIKSSFGTKQIASLFILTLHYTRKWGAFLAKFMFLYRFSRCDMDWSAWGHGPIADFSRRHNGSVGFHERKLLEHL